MKFYEFYAKMPKVYFYVPYSISIIFIFLFSYFLIFLYFVHDHSYWNALNKPKFYWKTNLITKRNIQQNWQLYILWVRWVNKLTIENMVGTLAIYWFIKSFWHPKSCCFVVKSEIIWYKSLMIYKVVWKLKKVVWRYLFNWVQMCEIDSQRSSHCPITCGVSQGSILEPILFLSYFT